jgi:uncharacterized protein (TIGR03000 family)
MYSVVLLMAMTGTPDTAAFGHKGSSCCGCQGACYGCQGCMGYDAGCCGCQGSRHSKKHSHGCCGCTGAPACGCCGCYGGGYGMPMAAPPMAPAMPPPKTGAMLPAPATVVVSLPADATLKVDGFTTKQTTELRTFATPVLPAGQSFHYTLTAEVVRNGQTLTASQQVTVRGGLTSQVELPTTAFGQTVVMK